MRLIRMLAQVIEEICAKDEKDYEMLEYILKTEKKIKFRKYERVPDDENRLRNIDITIEI